ncbi:MAG: response regulator transcription factor [Bacteroidetes bacterium]|nr:MAG: response regulator transcription factor [Bacteroidota bacterium]
MANIILIDDHEMVMDSLKYLIEEESEHQVVAKLKSSQTALEYLSEHAEKTDLILVDVKLPDGNGVDLTAQIHEIYPEIRIIILSQYANPDFVRSGLKNGASGYLLKSSDGHELTAAIDRVVEGKQFLCEEATKALTNSDEGLSKNYQLTPREKDVLKLIAMGKTSKEIGEDLLIEASTVDFHKRNLKIKLNAHKISDLTKCGIELGLVEVNLI